MRRRHADCSCDTCELRAALQARPDIRALPREPRYSVSESGEVYGIVGQQLKTYIIPGGYLATRVTIDGRSRSFLVHRLVMEAFVGPCPEGMHVLHGNGIPNDNRLANLRYGTQSENMLDALAHGTHPVKSRTHCWNGHLYTPETTGQIVRRGSSCRVCLICYRAMRVRKADARRARVAAARRAAA